MATGTCQPGSSCTSCGGLIVAQFNTNDCKQGCRPAPPQPWPFWSSYAGCLPQFMTTDVFGSSTDPDSRFKVADVVVGWKPPAGTYYTWDHGFCPPEVFCIKNTTWSAAVNKYHRISSKQQDLLAIGSGDAPDWVKQQLGFSHVAMLVRQP